MKSDRFWNSVLKWPRWRQRIETVCEARRTTERKIAQHNWL